MFTNNYIGYQNMAFEGSGYFLGNYVYLTTTSNESQYTYDLGKCQYGNLGYWLIRAKCSTFPVTPSSSSHESCGGVYFGSGSTPATKSDYTLESPISTGLTITNPNVFNCTTNGAGQWVISASYVLTNTTAGEINIYEVGVVTPLYASKTYRPFLMERTVLTAPITIAPGEAKLVTYKITFNQPTV